ncbi:MAG: tripartite tricarboxylate transporter TctB family protein [Desulfobacterales bacterium]
MAGNLFAFKNLFALALTGWFGYVAWEAFRFPYLAKVLPLSVGACLFVLGIVNLIQQVMRTARDVEKEGGGFADLSTDWKIPIELVWRRFFIYLAMLLLLYVLIWAVGYPLTMTLFIFIFYRFFAGASWWASAVGGLAGLAFLALTSHVLRMQWPEGLLTLPWPLG